MKDATVDARGFSCPQPVLMTLNAIKKESGATISVLVDTEVSKENVIRAADSRGWSVKSEGFNGETYELKFSRR